ncbi:nucleic acid-binding protein [Natronorubrum sp. JWXQ-INN-674]|uniref:Nucleic acid-binding protein n=1 Tax=Natronorubrum halalkaliphilum TaxID=2691917 RepID=A0A6B0VHI2_9EURY|nr:Zn-ribbon domain-containing OB-fold protein [Natronorubrum halalkaliphilum]MXV60575.1 nucleic acid-binding protein [Natronorubrum halalkaliphilum]
MTATQETGYDEFLDALEAGEGYYAECSNGHGTLPPRRVCPHCGDRELETVPLAPTGEIVTYTTVSVPTPAFDDDAPYVTAIASFGPVRLTGIVRNAGEDDLEIGREVTVTIEPTETTDERTIAFEP